MKKRIHIFDEDIVEKRIRPYFEAQRSRHNIATSKGWPSEEHGGKGYACFDFTVPYPEDKEFDGTNSTQYFDPTTRQSAWVYRRANYIAESINHAINWVRAKWMEHGIPGYWVCLICGFSTVDDPKFPEHHHHAKDQQQQIVPRILEPPPPEPPLPIGTFYATRLRPDSEQWVVRQISPKPYEVGVIPWSGKKLSTYQTKQEAKQELMKRITKK